MKAALVWLLWVGGVCACEVDRHPAFYDDPAPFLEAIKAAPGAAAIRPSGLTVPHHMLVPELIADGIGRARGHRYDRIVVLFPDHFRVMDAAFGTVTNDFDTVLGEVKIDPLAVEIASQPDFSTTCDLAQDHGLRALLPFVAKELPGVPVLPIAISIRTGREDWEALIARLTPLITNDTLILQSTDFSHYLPQTEARQFDQETLNVLAAGDLEALVRLDQPAHLDSTGAMYVQMALQQRVFGAQPIVLANENSQTKTTSVTAETTSYVVALFTGQGGVHVLPMRGKRVIVGGDTFFGRGIPAPLSDERNAARLDNAVAEITRGLPLILNLEGVLLPDMPPDLPHLTLAMPAALAAKHLQRWGVTAAGLENNHASDLGPGGLRETQAALRAAGIAPMGQLRLPGLTITALSDFDPPDRDTLTAQALDRAIETDATRASVALIHWGREFETRPRPRETQIAEDLRRRGVSVIIGAHPHVASDGIVLLGGGETAVIHSLGNFFFDQTGDVSSGAIAEVTTFPQGTVFVRQHPIPNLFERAQGRVRK